MTTSPTLARTRFADADAFLFDLDGVLAPTSQLHQHAWRALFAQVLPDLGDTRPYSDVDYFAYVDGRPAEQAVLGVLQSRGLTVDWGHPHDAPHTRSAWGLAAGKDAHFRELLATDGISTYPGTLRLLERLRELGRPAAVVSPSVDAPAVLDAAAIRDFFALVVDGRTVVAEELAGEPSPQPYLHAASHLGVDPSDCVVLGGAVSGVRDAAAGQFRVVLGVDRGAGARALLSAGADLVVDDLQRTLPLLPAARLAP